MKNIFICTIIFFSSCQSNGSEKKAGTGEPGIVNTPYDSVIKDDENSHVKKDSLPVKNVTKVAATTPAKNGNNDTPEKNDKPGSKQDGTGEQTTPKNNDVYPGNKGVLSDTADENTVPKNNNGKAAINPGVSGVVKNYPGQKANLSDTAAENNTANKKYRLKKYGNKKS